MAETPTLTITVTLADGGTVYEPGDLINIAWELDHDTSSNEFSLWQSSRNLRVYLADSDGNKLNLKSRGITKSSGRIDHNLVNEVDPFSGTYDAAFPDNPVQWKLPYNLDAGDYKIIVHRRRHSNQGGTSAAFTFTTEYDLNITAPTAADDDWERGTQENITWDETDVDNVTTGTLYYRLLGGTNGDWVEISALTGVQRQTKTYAWDIPVDLKPGRYQVGLFLDLTGYDSEDDTYYAISDEEDGFIVVDRTITINAPALSEKILEDTADYSITWTASSGYSSTDELTLYYSRDGGEWTVVEGGIPALNSAAITAWADAGGGKVTATSVGHGLSNGDTAVIPDTTNYNGTFIISNRADNTFEITATWVIGSEGDTGTWQQGYTWNTSDPSLDPGNYRIAIRDTNYDETQKQTESDEFLIVEKNIEITFPYAGALLHRGTGGTPESYKITWEYDGYGDADTISIKIKDPDDAWGVADITLTAAVALSTDEFAWDIDSDFTPGAYNMRITRGTDTYPVADFVFAVSDSLSDFNRMQRITSLVAVQKSKVYYSRGSWMKKLVDYQDIDATINPTNHVAVFSAFQKVFVLDGNYREDEVFPGFRFIDFGNLRMTGTLEGSLVGGDILVGTANGSIIIVDYIETVGTANVLYGQVISGGVIGIEEEFELDDSNGFTVSAFTDPPHWLDWDEVIESGALPETCNIGCAWKGRIVMAGNSARPHQWYMSRAGDPFDFLYAQGDARSPISGGDSNISEVGDIITSLVPYNADTLLFGTHGSVEIMRGNPAAGGSLDSFFAADGIFGPHSWCIDSNNIFYWVGIGGMYRAAIGSSYPVSITHSRIPKFLDGISRETHWITLVFDIERNGVLIFIINSDVNAKPEDGEAYGDMQAYWYDIATGGIFPEEYPSSTGVFSALNYAPEVTSNWYQPPP